MGSALAGWSCPAQALSSSLSGTLGVEAFGASPDAVDDQSAAFQRAIDASSASRRPVFVPPGRYSVSNLSLRPGAHMIGIKDSSLLAFSGQGSFLRGAGVNGVRLEDLSFSGERLSVPDGEGLVHLIASNSVSLSGCRFDLIQGHGFFARECSGVVSGCTFSNITDVGIRSLDATGLVISDNQISDCGNAGIHVWRSVEGPDGTQVTRNRISNILSLSGGTGQNGNGVNVFRAGNVQVSDNVISDVAFSAVRGNAASNLQIIGNLCARHGETALYSEFGFQGAVIANNIVEDAALGISIANLIDDGRLATCTGNLIRNLKKALPYEDDGFRYGTGIACEGDTTVTGNVVQGAPGFGLLLGWGPYLKNVTATGNVIRNAGTGVYVSMAEGAGPAVVADNLFAGLQGPAIAGYRWQEQVTDDLQGKASPVAWLTVRGNHFAG